MTINPNPNMVLLVREERPELIVNMKLGANLNPS